MRRGRQDKRKITSWIRQSVALRVTEKKADAAHLEEGGNKKSKSKMH